jgi:RecA/RadA recombinase
MIFDVDLALGGGFPRRKFIQIYGPESGGKSVLMYKAMAGLQMYCRYCIELFRVDENGEEMCACPVTCDGCKTNFQFTEYTGPPATEDDPFDWEKIHDEWECECLVQKKGTKAKKDRIPKITRRAARSRGALFDAEQSFDRDWAEFLGVDCDLLFVFLPEYAEQGIDIADKLLRTKEIDILGIDSIAELTPMKEIEASSEEWQMGLSARLVNKALRRWNASLNSFGVNVITAPSILLINQVRANLGGYEEVCPGGAGQKYKSSIRVRVNTAKYKYKESGTGAAKIKEMLFADMSGFTRKNKTYPPMKQYSYRLYVDDYEGHPAGTTNELAVIVERAIEFDVIDRPNKTTYTLELDDYSFKWGTQKAIAKAMAEDHALMWAIRDKTMEIALEQVR